ncbi:MULTISPECIES: TetR/AcrR family transcriptional regulator [unclassified Pseudomonas]|uniref:TetR/AcrR family transcriptional regulator n=1 Tax=unclassified Pseudomonas TaxID=196821 RepID=UPI002096DE6A|nr:MULTISPECIES: TetR/AcrR family transcriptional regulator [unclassified Pseudomonas]MCO7519521.1 TetR/AcrR family transcriptional regulator [Pseudomonas sp. 1]MCO7542207.1 TetR/AcrR family transcriptional regulator [Pseudomonas sp. VA159-2]
MVRRTRAEMEETRATLLSTARQVFSEHGYVGTSMDDLTARAGLTRGALYHHFGDKQGLLEAVVAQIDDEVDQRLNSITDSADDAWDGFRRRCRAYLEMALERDIQRIVLRDARAVLGGASQASHQHCLATMQRVVQRLVEEGVMVQAEPRALAALIYGSLAEAAVWIAQGDDGDARLVQSLEALDLLLHGLLAGK